MGKISNEQASTIKGLYGAGRGRGHRAGPGEVTLQQLADMYNVSVPAIRKALKRKDSEHDGSES